MIAQQFQVSLGFGSGLKAGMSMSNYIDGPSCKIIFCAYCGKFVNKTVRGRKLTCTDECAVLYQRQVWNRQHAEKMAKNPDYAKEQSARQYARIKSDPEKLAKHQQVQRERNQMQNYRESLRKGWKKYKHKNREQQTQRMRRYRDLNPEIMAAIEERRLAKRSAERFRLKIEEPEKYQELLAREAEYHRKLKAEKRLAELQKEMSDMVNKDE